jgi:uncharacterized protein (TIGR02145 family)
MIGVSLKLRNYTKLSIAIFLLPLFFVFTSGCSNGLNLLGGGSGSDSAQSPSYSEGTVTINELATVNISNSNLRLTGRCSSDFGAVFISCPSAIEPNKQAECTEDQTYSASCDYSTGVDFLRELVRVRQENLFTAEAVVSIDTQAPVLATIDSLSEIQEGFYVSAAGAFPVFKNLMVFCEPNSTVIAVPGIGSPTYDDVLEVPCQSGSAVFPFTFLAVGDGVIDVSLKDEAGNLGLALSLSFKVVEKALENIELNPTKLNLSQPNLVISGDCTEGGEMITILCSDADNVPMPFLCDGTGSFVRTCEYDINAAVANSVTEISVVQQNQPQKNYQLIADFEKPSPVTVRSESEIKPNEVLRSGNNFPIFSSLSLNCEDEASVHASIQAVGFLVNPINQIKTCAGGVVNFEFSFLQDGLPEIVIVQTDVAGNASDDEAIDNFYIASRMLGNLNLTPTVVNRSNRVLTVAGDCSVGTDQVKLTCPGSLTGNVSVDVSCRDAAPNKDTFSVSCTYANDSVDITDTISLVQGEQSIEQIVTVDTIRPANLVVTGDQDGKGIYNRVLPQDFTFTLACEPGNSLNFAIVGGGFDPSNTFPTECLGTDQAITISVASAGTIQYSGTQTDQAGNSSAPATFQFIVEESNVVSGELFSGLGATCDEKFIEKSDCAAGSINYRGVPYSHKKIGESCWLLKNIEETPTAFRVSPVWDENTNNGAFGTHPDVVVNDGKFYTQAAAMNDVECVGLESCDRERAKGVCPTGWHIPSDCEWMAYEKFAGMTIADQEDEGERLSGIVGEDIKTGAFDGMSMPLAGFRNPNGVYGGRGSSVRIWTSTETAASSMMTRAVRDNADSEGMYRSPAAKSGAAVVRCVKDGAPLEVNRVDGTPQGLTARITPGAFPILLEGSCDQTLGDVTVEGLEGSPHFVTCVNNTWSIERNVNSHVVISQKNGTRKFTKYRNNATYEVSPTFCDGAHCLNNTVTADFICQQKHGPLATRVGGSVVPIDVRPADPFNINGRIGGMDQVYGDEFEYQKGTDEDTGTHIDGCENCTAANAIKSVACTVTVPNMN